MNGNYKNEYSKRIKQREIMEYILEHGENFDYMELARYMEMTYGQLRKLIKCLLNKHILVVQEGILKVSIIYENMYSDNMENQITNCNNNIIMDDRDVYVPENFIEKFSGY